MMAAVADNNFIDDKKVSGVVINPEVMTVCM
jgi:hypothetical protein